MSLRFMPYVSQAVVEVQVGWWGKESVKLEMNDMLAAIVNRTRKSAYLRKFRSLRLQRVLSGTRRQKFPWSPNNDMSIRPIRSSSLERTPFVNVARKTAVEEESCIANPPK
jgi:hypothetical protein